MNDRPYLADPGECVAVAATAWWTAAVELLNASVTLACFSAAWLLVGTAHALMWFERQWNDSPVQVLESEVTK